MAEEGSITVNVTFRFWRIDHKTGEHHQVGENDYQLHDVGYYDILIGQRVLETSNKFQITEEGMMWIEE